MLDESKVLGKGLSTLTALIGLLSSVTYGVLSEGEAVGKTLPTFLHS